MTSNNIKTGHCSQCGTYNSASLRCNCANKVLTERDLTPTTNLDDPYTSYIEQEITTKDRDGAFAQTGQLLSDDDTLVLFGGETASYISTKELFIPPKKEFTPSYYGAKCKCGAKLDPYIICDAYATNHNKGSAWHHAVKKLLRAGDGHKPLHQDIQEVIDTLKRWQEQINA